MPTNMCDEIFRDSACFDALCYGEGEKPLLGLVQAADKKGFLANNSSWITKEKVNILFSPLVINLETEISFF